MAKYRYKKYASVLNYSRDNEVTGTKDYYDYAETPMYDLKYSDVYPWKVADKYIMCDMLTGYYFEGLSPVSSSTNLGLFKRYAMIVSPTVVRLVRGNGYTLADAMSRDNGVNVEYQYTITPTNGKGDYIGEVTAEDGTYPDNGYNSADGCWYVKDRKATNMLIKSGGYGLMRNPVAELAACGEAVSHMPGSAEYGGHKEGGT